MFFTRRTYVRFSLVSRQFALKIPLSPQSIRGQLKFKKLELPSFYFYTSYFARISLGVFRSSVRMGSVPKKRLIASRIRRSAPASQKG